jgi:hypothetical protein
MRFLNPKTDFAFKRIFGSERSHDISCCKFSSDGYQTCYTMLKVHTFV